jgi:hypothetical protein
MGDARCVVCPNPHFTGFHERVLAAMSAGAAVVSTPNLVFEAQFAHNRDVIFVRNESQLVQILERALADSAWLQPIATSGHRLSAKLFSPQRFVDMILSIDDMRGHEKWETFLRPIIERLKQIDGRAPLSIMTNTMNKPEEASRGNVLSVQEEAIHAGRPTLHGTATDRVLRLYEAIRGFGPPRVTLDRAVLFTESFKETENQPLVLRWAKALKNFAEKAPVTIFSDELIVGRPNTWLGRWGIVYPELDGEIMPSGVEMFRQNKGKPGEVVVTEEDGKVISDVLTPYWTGKDY